MDIWNPRGTIDNSTTSANNTTSSVYLIGTSAHFTGSPSHINLILAGNYTIASNDSTRTAENRNIIISKSTSIVLRSISIAINNAIRKRQADPARFEQQLAPIKQKRIPSLDDSPGII